jgi:hypothetical protein
MNAPTIESTTAQHSGIRSANAFFNSSRSVNRWSVSLLPRLRFFGGKESK